MSESEQKVERVGDRPATVEGDVAARSHGNPSVVVDKGSDLVDPDPNFSGNADQGTRKKEIVFAYAGANAGGESLGVCMGLNGCGALVQEVHQDRHVQWHQNGLI